MKVMNTSRNFRFAIRGVVGGCPAGVSEWPEDIANTLVALYPKRVLIVTENVTAETAAMVQEVTPIVEPVAPVEVAEVENIEEAVVEDETVPEVVEPEEETETPRKRGRKARPRKTEANEA